MAPLAAHPLQQQHTILKTVSRLTAAGEVSHCRTVCANRVPAVRPLCGEQSLHHGYHCTLGAQAQVVQGSAGARNLRQIQEWPKSGVSGALATRIDKHVAT